MAFEAVCPGCGARYDLREDMSGKKVRCKKCQQLFLALPGQDLEDEDLAADEEEVRPRNRRAEQPRDDREDRPRRKKSKKKKAGFPVARAAIIGTAALVILLLLGGGLYLAYTYMIVSEVPKPVTDADRAVVLTADKLAAKVRDIHIVQGQEKITKVRQRTGTYVLRSTYGTADPAKRELYFQCTVAVSPRESEAQSIYTQSTGPLDLGPGWDGKNGLRKSPLQDLFHWGNESEGILLMRGSTFVGNVLSTRKGKRVFHLVILGYSFHDPKKVQALFNPILEQFDHYEP